MTTISDQELIQKMLKSMAALRSKSLGSASFGPMASGKFRRHGFGGQHKGFSFGPMMRSVHGSQPNGDQMFPGGNFTSMNSNGSQMEMGAGPMMDHRGLKMVFPGFRSRQGLVRENLLTIIAEAPEGIRAKDVAKKAGVNQSSVSESLSKLEDDGYLKRTTDPSDKRATLIFLTDLGKARANEIADQQQEIFGHLFDSLTDDEKVELARLLDKIIDGENE